MPPRASEFRPDANPEFAFKFLKWRYPLLSGPPRSLLGMQFFEADFARGRGQRGRYRRTTARCDRRSEETMREAVRALFVPYSPRPQ